MLQPNDLKIKTDTENPTFGKYSLEPLPEGTGRTLGNSLRRMLLSSIPGAAVTSVKFANANHQFTTIPGVKEDVIDIILNLKSIHFQLATVEPTVVSIDVKGVGEVKAKDLDLPAGVTVTNPEQLIATVGSKGAKLEAEIIVSPGVGYEPAEEHETNKIGVIAVDSLFSPVISVNYKVEAARVGQKSDFDRLILEIITNGVVTPKEALMSSAQQLVGFFERIANGEESIGDATVSSSGTSHKQKAVDTSEILLEELSLPTRTINALKRSGLKSLADLAAMPDEEILRVKNLGEKSVAEIAEILKKEGLR